MPGRMSGFGITTQIRYRSLRVVQLKNPRLWNFKTGGEDGQGETGLIEVPLMFRETKPSS